LPEGDSLRRAAALVAPVLEGQVLTEAWFGKLRGHRPRPGQCIHRVAAVGKHLTIEFDRGLVLDTHLGMSGYWRVAAPGVVIGRDPRLRIRLGTQRGQALCYAAPSITTFLKTAPTSPLAALGPDLSEDSVDLDEVMRRLEAWGGERTVAEALLDQSLAAGVGNVFKSEVLFAAGVHPFTPLGLLDEARRRRVWSTAHRLLVSNRDRAVRVTTARGVEGRTYVYGRARRGCRVCADAVRFSPAGERTGRSTYWCPTCQPEGGSSSVRP
jgi:endonuclease VIII